MDIDLSGPLCRFFAEQAGRLTGKPDILEVKHVFPKVPCMKTRGQLTVAILSDLSVLQAEAGGQVHTDIIDSAQRRWADVAEEVVPENIKEWSENAWLLEVFFSRIRQTRIPSWSFTSMRKMAYQDYDLVKEEMAKRINLDFDWKRELADPEMQVAGIVIAGENPRHLTLNRHRSETSRHSMKSADGLRIGDKVIPAY